MSRLSDYMDDYAARHPGWREASDKVTAAFFADVPETAYLNPVPFGECTEEHPDLAGVNMDIGQCLRCWHPMGVMRPYGESFGWHADDCSLPMLHPGYCAPGGSGHIMPDGWRLRG